MLAITGFSCKSTVYMEIRLQISKSLAGVLEFGVAVVNIGLPAFGHTTG